MPPRQADNDVVVIPDGVMDSQVVYEFDDDTKTIDFLVHEDDGEENGNCGRAVIKEFKRTVGNWWFKEMTNFNQKTIAVSFFIFFAAVAPAITFGAVYSKVRSVSGSRLNIGFSAYTHSY
jgi:hypothetical protein